jgi:Ca2+-binding RTX toxin-like protein
MTHSPARSHRLSWLLARAAFAASVAAFLPAPTRAEDVVTDVSLRVTGVTFIGGANGRLLAGTLSLLGCTWRDLGPSALTTSYALHGTAGNDTIRVVDALNVIWCNRILQPITQNGHAFKVYGGDGDDIIYGGGYAPFAGNPNWIYGEAGNDTLYLGSGGAQGDGGLGDDRIFGGDSTSDVLIGGAGDDVLCEHSDVQPLTLDGGDGFDTSCSPRTSAPDQFVSIDLVSCLACGLGY